MSEEFVEEQLKAFFKTKAGKKFLSEEMTQAFKFLVWHNWKELPYKVRRELADSTRRLDQIRLETLHLLTEKVELEQAIADLKAELEEYVPARVIARMKGSKNV